MNDFLKWMLGAEVPGQDTSDSNPYPEEDEEQDENDDASE